MRILIVNDRHSEVWFIERVLQKMGLEFTSAFDGEDALKKLDENIPCLIILDTIMPRMDGYTFYQRLTARADFAAIPVLVVTDKGEQYEKPRLTAQPKTVSTVKSRLQTFVRGRLMFITKPVQPDELERNIRILLTPSTPETTAADADVRRPRVLIIDDDMDLVERVTSNLQAYKIEVISAAGGLAGLSRVKEFTPDLVVLDTILPELDGLRVLQYLKQRYKMPVIMIPGRAEADLLNKALLCGAEGYLIKPFEPNVLASFVQKKLSKMNKIPPEA